MSVLEEVLMEEYNRSLRIRNALVAEQESLPKGSIQIKNISGNEYHYLMYREGDKVISRYLKPEEIDGIKALINKRKENSFAIKELDISIRQIVKTLGRKYIDEHTA